MFSNLPPADDRTALHRETIGRYSQCTFLVEMAQPPPVRSDRFCLGNPGSAETRCCALRSRDSVSPSFGLAAAWLWEIQMADPGVAPSSIPGTAQESNAPGHVAPPAVGAASSSAPRRDSIFDSVSPALTIRKASAERCFRSIHA